MSHDHPGYRSWFHFNWTHWFRSRILISDSDSDSVSIHQSPSLCNAIQITDPCLLAIQIHLVRELTGVPSGTILFGGPSGIILAMLPEKKLGLTTIFGHSEISNISEITSCRIMIWGSKPIFSWSRNQINTLYSMVDHYYGCKRTKNMKKSKMAANFTLYFGKCVIALFLVTIKRWFWCLNLGFHVWGF